MRGAGSISLSRRAVTVVALGSLLVMPGCGGQSKPAATAKTQVCDGRIEGKQTIQAWFHAGSAGDEVKTQKELTNKFNASQSQVQVQLSILPGQPVGANFYDLIQAGDRAGTLPTLLEFDGPAMSNLAYRGQLLPLDSCISASLREDLLPSLRQAGTFQGKLYALGAQGDSGLGVYSRRSILQKAKIRIPTSPADAWTAAEVTAMLPKLRAIGFVKPLDLKLSIGDEWYTYGFSPVIQSAGGDLVQRPDLNRATGVLNSPASVKALKTLQSWKTAGYVDDDADERAFVSGRSAISWVGHWQFTDYRAKYGDDLIILPLPRFGERTATGMGSWVWGLSKATGDIDAGWAYLAFLMQPENQVKWTSANHLIPATKTGAADSPLFAPGGPERMYYEQLVGGYAVPRPPTPGYPVITKAFQAALQDILTRGGDVQANLDKAAAVIDADMKANDDYKTPPTPTP